MLIPGASAFAPGMNARLVPLSKAKILLLATLTPNSASYSTAFWDNSMRPLSSSRERLHDTTSILIKLIAGLQLLWVAFLFFSQNVIREWITIYFLYRKKWGETSAGNVVHNHVLSCMYLRYVFIHSHLHIYIYISMLIENGMVVLKLSWKSLKKYISRSLEIMSFQMQPKVLVKIRQFFG